MSAPGVIDITDGVEKLRQTWVDWAVLYVYGQEIAIPGLTWVALPVISTIDKMIIQGILDSVSKSAVMLAFFGNTFVLKASQAQDFVDAVSAQNKLPPTASPEEYANAEKNRMSAFRSFVTITG